MVASRVAFSVFIIFAHLATATVHLCWNELAKDIITLVRICLTTSSESIFQAIVKLHTLVLFSFAVAAAFKFTSAAPAQDVLLNLDLHSLLTVSAVHLVL